jgi:glucokinase
MLLSKKLGVDVWVENDANVAAVGQKVFGQAKDLTDFLVITVGTGIGTGIYTGNNLLCGANGYAGEGGHIIVGEKGRPCNCGGVDHFESYCSVGSIKKVLANRGLTNSYREAVQIVNGNTENAKKLFPIFEEAAVYFANAMHTLEVLFRPQKVFLTGGGITSNPIYFSLILERAKHLEVDTLISLLPDSLGESAILGAAAGALTKAKPGSLETHLIRT